MATLVGRSADYAPVVPACCNVCRTCTTTNAVGLATAGAAALGAAIWRLGRRFAKAA
jgi:hypothetical protein